MSRLTPLALIAFALVSGCIGTNQGEEAAPSTTVTATMETVLQPTVTTKTSAAAPIAATTTTEVVFPTTTTLVSFDDGIAEIEFRDDVDIASHHQTGIVGPVTGWVSAETQIPVSIRLSADHGEQLVKIGYSTAVANADEYGWGATGLIHLDPGVNEVPIVVAGISPPLSISVPITYLPGAMMQLAVVTDADEEAITLDYGYYYWDGSFPSIGDHDPGVLETVAVASDAYVILSDELIVEYWWFLEQRQDGTHHDETGWHPSADYTYYWATIYEGQLVELWWIPLG